jgi:hypothetical protein
VDITDLTRRAIADELTLNRIYWSGKLHDGEFLARMYDLSALPSHDFRYSTAAQDIWKHTVANDDWEPDWMFTDDRFDLLRCPDEEFLRFLCETLHPVVRPDPESVAQLLGLYNRHLRADGWELFEQAAISGRPVFAARQLVDGAAHAIDAAQAVANQLNAGYIAQQVTRLQAAVHNDPELAIGTAKEFVETVCTTILAERSVTCDPGLDLLRLVRRAMEELDLVPDRVDDAAKAAGTIKALLGNLATVAQRMAELRNPYGTGHGKAAGARGLQPRHARLAVGAATSLAVFLFETYQEKFAGGA